MLYDNLRQPSISNLLVLSKLVECLVARQLTSYLVFWNLLPELQSAYCTNHSTESTVHNTETAVSRVL